MKNKILLLMVVVGVLGFSLAFLLPDSSIGGFFIMAAMYAAIAYGVSVLMEK